MTFIVKIIHLAHYHDAEELLMNNGLIVTKLQLDRQACVISWALEHLLIDNDWAWLSLRPQEIQVVVVGLA